MGKEKSFLRQWLASETIAPQPTPAEMPTEAAARGDAACDKAAQPTLRQVLSAINRVVSEDRPGRVADSGRVADDAAGKTPLPGESPAPSVAAKAPLVAKLTTPLGKAQRDNLLVMSLLGLDVFLGATFGLIGYFGLESHSIAMAGAVIVAVGIAAMALYQRFGRER